MEESDATVNAVIVARGASHLIAMYGVIGVINIITTAVILRTLTQSDVGMMAILLLIVGLSAVGVGFGVPGAIGKLIPERLGASNLQAAHVMRLSLKISLSLSIIVGSIIVIMSDPISTIIAYPNSSIIFRILGIDVMASGVYQTFFQGLIAFQKTKQLAIIEPFRMLVQQVMGIALLQIGWGLIGIMLGWIVGYTFFAVVAAPATLVNIDQHKFLMGRFADLTLRQLLAFAIPLYFSDLASYAYTGFDRALLAAYVPLTSLGTYNVASTVFGFFNYVPNSIAGVLYPHYSKVAGQLGANSLQASVRTASRYVAFTATPLSLGLAAVATPVLGLFAGAAYESGGIILTVMCIFLAATLISSSLGGLLVVVNRPKQFSAATMLSVIASTVSGFILLQHFGMTGVAIARGLGMVAMLLSTVFLLTPNFDLRIDVPAIWKSGLASVVMAVLVFTFQSMVRNPYYLPLYVVIGGATYLLMMRVLRAVNNDDLGLARDIMGERWSPLINLFARLLVP